MGKGIFAVLKETFREVMENSKSENSQKMTIAQKIRCRALTMTDIGGYVSPSGGYCNYGIFEVVAIKKETGRKNKRVYKAKTEEEAKEQARAEGLIDPMEVKVLPAEKPTEAQLRYARNLGAIVPPDAGKWDVSEIIDRMVNEDEKSPNPQNAKYADDMGLKFSKYIGECELYERLSCHMANEYDATYYCYEVYQTIHGKKECYDPREEDAYSVFLGFAEIVRKDESLKKSLISNCHEWPKKQTKIYKAARDWLEQNGVI